MNPYVFYFDQIDNTRLPDVGGKGANLGEMSRAGFPVPRGFCISTRAYKEFIAASTEMDGLLDSLDRLQPDQLDEIGRLGQRIRDHLMSVAVPETVKSAVIEGWQKYGENREFAVRSSATAEDLPTASFAGQQETYLNVKGPDQLLKAVQKCWASLFTDRAIAYRARNGFDHRDVFLSVVVQQMVFPEVSGIMFTADPVTGNRRVVSIDASFGLGEALVSGIVSADLYQVKAEKLIKKKIARKEIAIYARPEGGTDNVELAEEMQTAPSLSEEQAVKLALMGRSIEGHFGSPQDIEWCLSDGEIYVLQSRPITTLYPVPPAEDNQVRLFLSFGHVQMMTEAIKPLGISVLRTFIPLGKSSPPGESDLLVEAGSRLYSDVITRLLEYPFLKKRLPELLLNVDEMFSRAVREFIEREEFQAAARPGKRIKFTLVRKAFPTVLAILKNILHRENDQAIDMMNRFIAEKVDENRKLLLEVSGSARITRIQEMLNTILSMAVAKVAQYLPTALITYKLIENLSRRWLGDTAEMGGISKSPPGNVTTEMGLALGDVADAVRSHPAVIEYLEHASDESFFENLKAVPGGEEVLPVFLGFFERYGMRGTGEIDVTRPRWREVPTQLVPAIMGHIRGVRPGQHRLDFLAGKKEADLAVERLLERLRKKPLGFIKGRIMRRLIKVHRSLIGIREHPKYFIVQNFDLIKQAILQEGDGLAAAGVLEQPEDVFWLSLQEIKEVLETRRLDRDLINRRKEKFQRDEKLAPPRAITSEGEIITAKPGAHVPPGTLSGSPVSAGKAEGRARVILKLAEAKMEKGDILVAPYTDPAWTPLFPLAAGLVTEVGGLMTHGAVVAREYGIPAVVGLDNATRKIRDGQLIRVDGTRGFVEILE
ncbi:phosphoenolpyruvate synthase [Pelotomaculum propionicicum]|uniref:phosphoenolpyruvate synthase n=1 Tax=Pelotomaculum propionicicum TaxID=258475 RepID=UPI003B7B42F6